MGFAGRGSEGEGCGMSTKVKNPCRRDWSNPYEPHGYSTCSMCKEKFTQLGISRHWDYCKENPKNKEKIK